MIARTLIASLALGVFGAAVHIAPIFFDTGNAGTPSSLVSFFSFISTIAFIGVGYALWATTSSIWAAFAVGTLIGLGYFGTSLYWLGQSVLADGTGYNLRAALTALGGWTLLYPWWSLAFTLAFALGRMMHIERPSINGAILFTLCFSICDVLMGDFAFGIPLAPLGSSVLDTLWHGALAGVGIHAVTALLTVIGAMLAVSRLNRSALYVAGTAFLILSVAAIFGPYPFTETSGPQSSKQIYLAQPMPTSAYDLSRSGSPDPAHDAFQNILNTIDAAGNADLIVLPENAVPYDLSKNNNIKQELLNHLATKQNLIVGFRRVSTLSHDNGSFDVQSHNTAYALSSAGEKLFAYDKSHLVPFGEYMPQIFHDIGFDVIAGPPSGFEAGPSLDVFTLDGMRPFSLLICYEALLSGPISRETGGANWLLNISSEGLFGETIGPRLLLRYVRIRAAETGLPVLRSTATAYSAVIDSTGTVVSSLGFNKKGGIKTLVPPSRFTIFRATGYFSLYALWFISLIWLSWAAKSAFKNHTH